VVPAWIVRSGRAKLAMSAATSDGAVGAVGVSVAGAGGGDVAVGGAGVTAAVGTVGDGARVAVAAGAG